MLLMVSINCCASFKDLYFGLWRYFPTRSSERRRRISFSSLLLSCLKFNRSVVNSGKGEKFKSIGKYKCQCALKKCNNNLALRRQVAKNFYLIQKQNQKKLRDFFASTLLSSQSH